MGRGGRIGKRESDFGATVPNKFIDPANLRASASEQESMEEIRKRYSRRVRIAFIWVLTIAVLCLVAALPPIPQDPAYHDFADRHCFLAIPNFWNVVSNAPFVLVGLLGLAFLFPHKDNRNPAALMNRWERLPYIALFVGIVLTGFGSAYYHLDPNNETLVWDRLPMAVAFPSFLALIVADRISIKAGVFSLAPFWAIGILSVIYWGLTEKTGHGDLRLYGFVHFYPMLLVPIIVLLFPPRYTKGRTVLRMFVFYGLATMAELLDREIYGLGGILSGHTIKHLFAALAVYEVARIIRRLPPGFQNAACRPLPRVIQNSCRRSDENLRNVIGRRH